MQANSLRNTVCTSLSYPTASATGPDHVQWDNANQNDTQFVDDTITISVRSCPVRKPARSTLRFAFFQDNLSASAAIKYQLGQQNLWAKSDNLSDGENFELTLDMSSFYTLASPRQSVYIKYYEALTSVGSRSRD